MKKEYSVILSRFAAKNLKILRFAQDDKLRRGLALLLCLSLTACLFSGCGGKEGEAYVPTGNALLMEGEEPTEDLGDQTPQEFSMVYYPDRDLNPLTSHDYTNRSIMSLIYQGLFAVDRDYTAVPILCKSFRVSPDSKTWTFYLEEGATFSDGTPLTVEDVLATYEAARTNSKEYSSYYAGRFTHIREIAATEDGGISINLNTAFENLPLLLDIPILKASEITAENPLGTGPYILTESLAGSQLRKNLNWWCGERKMVVTAESIPLVTAQSDTHIRDQFEFEDVGIVCANPCSDSYADYRCDYELWDVDNGVMLYLGFNITYAQEEFFADVNVRKAFTYAIDRQELVDTFYNGFAQAASLPASPSSPWYSQTLAENYAFNPMKFIDSLSRMKQPKEPLRLIVNKDDSVRLKVADYIAATLNDYGLNVEVKKYDTATFTAVYYAGNFDFYVGQVRLSPNMDLSSFYGPLGSLHYNGTDDAATYSLCKDALANSGNYYNLHQRVMEDARIIPLVFHRYNVYADRGLVTDLTPSRDNVFFYTLDKTCEGIQLETIYDEEPAA